MQHKLMYKQKCGGKFKFKEQSFDPKVENLQIHNGGIFISFIKSENIYFKARVTKTDVL